MGIFDFIRAAGKAIGIGAEDTPPTADDLKKELDVFNGSCILMSQKLNSKYG